MDAANSLVSKPMTKADQAIEYMNAHSVTVYAAAKAVDVSPSAVYRRIDQLRALAGQRCHCCGQIVPETV